MSIKLLFDKETLSKANLFIPLYMADEGLTITTDGLVINPQGKVRSSALDDLYIKYRDYVYDYNEVNPNKATLVNYQEMQRVYDQYFRNTQEEKLDCLTTSLLSREENLKPLKQFIAATSGSSPNAHLDLAVMAHFIQMIKRKMQGSDVKNHLMPVFFGKQGSGKTVAVSKLLSPIQGYTYNFSVNEAVDTRNAQALSRKYAVIFDEMEGSRKADVEGLKSRITADVVSSRVLATHSVGVYKQNCSFIGTTNRSITEHIHDSTGMRRFYEVHVQDQMDWDAINSIDYKALWQGISDSKNYLEHVMDELRANQEENITPEPIAQFLEDTASKPVGKEELKDVSTYEVYKQYASWCEAHNVQVENQVVFGRKLGTFGIKSKPRKLDGVVIRIYELSGKTTIPGLRSSVLPFSVKE